MSEEVRIALVAEGETDRIVIECAVQALLRGRPFVLRQIQPEESVAFGPIGTGWGGVYRWCKQAAAEAGGHLRNDPLFRNFHLLILHLDADVAGKTYADLAVEEVPNDLPCEQPCPPPSATTNEMRKVMLRWAGETLTPETVVLCTPSKATEAWVIAALFADEAIVNGDSPAVECHPDPATWLATRPLAQRIRKKKKEYSALRGAIEEAWARVAGNLSEAARFQADFLARIPVPL
jgi:hypothetical protein